MEVTPKIFSIQSDIYSSTAACAAARRAMGTRNGEQLDLEINKSYIQKFED
jgi:hypothetical protein